MMKKTQTQITKKVKLPAEKQGWHPVGIFMAALNQLYREGRQNEAEALAEEFEKDPRHAIVTYIEFVEE